MLQINLKAPPMPEGVTVTTGDCLATLRTLEADSVDSIVCDPPYGLGFMGHTWDVAVPGVEWARECLRVLKPGGHLVAFGGTRTIHRLTSAIEDAGFEVRDTISWLYWTGFPKSLDVSKAIDKAAGAEREVVDSFVREGRRGGIMGEKVTITRDITAPATPDAVKWNGWGTALKPAQEPAVLARKPLPGTVAQSVLANGTGALHIDACRYAQGDPAWPGPQDEAPSQSGEEYVPNGANRVYGTGMGGGVWVDKGGRWPANIYACPKASRAEKEAGLGHLPASSRAELTGREEGSAGINNPRASIRSTKPIRNIHSTVKPIELMRWLCRLVTPPGGLIVDPFMGSGSTGCAAVIEGFRFHGMELSAEYVTIAEARIAYWGSGAATPRANRVPTVADEQDEQDDTEHQTTMWGGR